MLFKKNTKVAIFSSSLKVCKHWNLFKTFLQAFYYLYLIYGFEAIRHFGILFHHFIVEELKKIIEEEKHVIADLIQQLEGKS